MDKGFIKNWESFHVYSCKKKGNKTMVLAAKPIHPRRESLAKTS
jgi:hypothetical protein